MAVISIPYKKSNGVNLYSTITFPDVSTLEENNFLNRANFYICFKKSGGNYYKENLLDLGNIKDITDLTVNEDDIPFAISSSSVAQAFILVKASDEKLNNAEYNDYITIISSDNNKVFTNRYGYTILTDYYSFTTTGGGTPFFLGGSNGYNAIEISGIEYIEPIEPDEPIEPTDKEIELTIFKNDSLGVKSNIDIYYSIDNENLIELGNSLNNDSFHFTIKSNEQVHIYFKYVNENVDVSKCIETFYLSNTNTYSVYNETKHMFYLGVITENDEIRENKYACPVLDLQLENCETNLTELNYTIDNTIELIVSENHYFNLVPYLYYDRRAYSTQKLEFTLNEDRTIATLQINKIEPLNNFHHTKLVANAEIKTDVSSNYGLITIYKPNDNILSQLPSKTLYEKSYIVSDSGIEKETIDLSKNILACLSIPLDIESVGSKEITLQGIKTDLVSDYINDNIYKIDFGYVDIQGIYHNSVDYKNTKLSIYLPFISSQSLDVNKYMNKRVYLSYIVDIFSGDFLAELKVNDLITDSFSGNMAIKVPYITNTEKSQNISSYSLIDKNNLLSDRVPKIIIETNTINNDTIFNTLEYKQLNTLSGYNSISNLLIPNDSSISNDDLLELENILERGVIF